MPASHVDLGARFGGVKDQGERPTCLAFAVTATHEVKRIKPGQLVEGLSEEALYWGCKRTDANARRGTSFRSAHVALDRWGQPLERVLPYNATKDDTRRPRMIPGAGGSGWFKAALRAVRVLETAIKSEIDAGVPVAVGLLLTDGFHRGLAGHIPAPAAGEKTLGGHAVTIVGYDERALRVFIIRNSWGPGWGNGGYGYLPYSYLSLVREAWAIA